eukprot:UN01991
MLCSRNSTLRFLPFLLSEDFFSKKFHSPYLRVHATKSYPFVESHIDRDYAQMSFL